MIKVEHHVIPERGILAISLESSSPQDNPLLDVLAEVFPNPTKYSMKVGFSSSNRLVVHITGFTKEEVDAAKLS